MPFIFNKTEIEGVYLIEPKCFGDARGYFMETYEKGAFDKAGLNYTFVQSNQSKSHKGVLRGLHFQTRHPQAKLVRVVKGEVYDVAVDLREGSPTYGKYVGATLNEDNHLMLLIPRGFAHGFLVLSDVAIFEYQVDDAYDPGFEGGVAWNDADIDIHWPLEGEPELSHKDTLNSTLKDAKPVFGFKNGHLELL